MTIKKKILVTIDNSPQCRNSLHYLAMLFQDAGPEEVEFDLIAWLNPSSGATQSWMMDVDPLRAHDAAQTALNTPQAAALIRSVKKAGDFLRANGFAKDQVSEQIRPRTGGLAVSICQHAQLNKYDAVVIGRRGLGAAGTLLAGSLSSSMVQICSGVPLWIIDGEVPQPSCLLAVLPHPQSLIAADHAAFILKTRPNVQFYLYHSLSLFGAKASCKAEEFHAQWGKDWCDEYLDLDNYLFYAHAQILKEHGVPSTNIHQLPMQSHLHPSHDLLKQAKKHKCGTIVLGKRYPREENIIFKGVSNRTLEQAEKQAIWIV